MLNVIIDSSDNYVIISIDCCAICLKTVKNAHYNLAQFKRDVLKCLVFNN